MPDILLNEKSDPTIDFGITYFQYEDLTKEEQAKHAFFLSLAALLGEGVFNFGELLAHKVNSTFLFSSYLFCLNSTFNFLLLSNVQYDFFSSFFVEWCLLEW